MNDHRERNFPSNIRYLVYPLLAAAACASLIGCESPLRSDYSGAEQDHLTQSMLYRAVVEGTYNSQLVGPTTINLGVRDPARVDQAGPAWPADTQPGSTNLPPISSIDLFGQRAATLEMPEPHFRLSLQDAVARAARHSLSIKVEGYNPAIKQEQIIEAEAAFDPVIFGSSQWTSTDEPPLSNTTIGFTNGQNWQNQIGIRKMLPTGGTLTASTTVTYRDIDTSGVPAASITTLGTFKTNYLTNISLQVTQPLLRGFGTNVNEANIYLAQRDARISLSDFKKTAIKAVSDVEDAYLSVVLARTNVDILVRLTKASEQTYNITNVRPDADDSQKFQALSAFWARTSDLVNAQTAYRQASDHLKSLLNDPEIDIRSNVLIEPTDKPVTEPIYYNIAECIQTALSQRPEMQASRLNVEKADIVVTVTKNDLLPRLDLTAGVQPNALQNGFEQAFTALIDPMNNIDWNAGVKLEIPIGNREAEARLARRQFERKQLLDTLVQNAQTVITDVKQQLRELLSSYSQLQVCESWRQAAAREFQALVQQDEIRPKSPERLQLVLDAQARLAAAEQALAQSMVNYNLAIMRLEGAKGTLLEFNRISLDHPPRTVGADDGLMRLMGNSYQYQPIFPIKLK